MAKILEFGCGGSPTEWLPGADLLDSQMCITYAKSFGFNKIYNQHVDLEHPHIDCPDNTYSIIRATCSILVLNKNVATLGCIANELYRITAHGGMVIMEDSIDPDTSLEEFGNAILPIFKEAGWGCSLFVHAYALKDGLDHSTKRGVSTPIMLTLEKDMSDDFDESCPDYTEDGCDFCEHNEFKEDEQNG